MIQKSRFNLNELQNKSILYLISKVQPGDTYDTEYNINCEEFLKIINWRTTSYTKIKEHLNELAQKQWWIDINDDEESIVRWFNIVHIHKKTGNIKIKFHQEMFPFIMDLNQQRERDGIFYTTYTLQSVTLMKSKYASRIYEILKSYQYNNERWRFELGTGSKYDLQRLISKVDEKTQKSIIPQGWSNYAIFNRDVLIPAKEDINKYTDIKIDYQPFKIDMCGKKHRRYCAIEFYMASKTKIEKEEAETIIDAEYKIIGEEYQQLTIGEIFFQERDSVKQAEEEKKKKEEKKEQKVSKKNTEEYAILSDLFPELKPKELDSLFHAAIKHVAGEINWDDREIWCADYISYYYDKIKATSEATKTTLYQRLLDMVIKDYYGKSAERTPYHKEALKSHIEPITPEKDMDAYIVEGDPDTMKKISELYARGITKFEIVSKEKYEEILRKGV